MHSSNEIICIYPINSDQQILWSHIPISIPSCTQAFKSAWNRVQDTQTGAKNIDTSRTETLPAEKCFFLISLREKSMGDIPAPSFSVSCWQACVLIMLILSDSDCANPSVGNSRIRFDCSPGAAQDLDGTF